MYLKFQQEALANVKEGGYANKEEALMMYRFYVHTLYCMARDGYYMFRARELGYTDKATHGIVPESRIREFIQNYFELNDESVNRVMFVMLHPEADRKDRYITERQGGGIVI